MLLTVVAFLVCCAARGGESLAIQPRQWEYNTNFNIGYEVAHSVPTKTNAVASNTTAVESINNGSAQETPILLLNGFGVGSFHQHRLIPCLLNGVKDSRSSVYCMDYLGQGRSWPKDCADGESQSEQGLQYSAETWVDQIIQFIVEIVQPECGGGTPCKVHLVGNSVGGHLASHVAVRRPDLIESIVLLNPTPAWGLNLPGWSGQLPAPRIPRAVGRFLFDRIRDLKTIETFLHQTYSRREAFSEELMHQIRGCTLGNGGHAAFASIMWSPPLSLKAGENNGDLRSGDFQDCLARVPCDVLLVFGRDDPWCKPAFARKMLRALEQREPDKIHRYIEISDAGHCPNHEAPRAVGHIVRSWTKAKDRSTNNLSLIQNGKAVFQEEWGDHTVRECGADEIPMGFVDRLATTFV